MMYRTVTPILVLILLTVTAFTALAADLRAAPGAEKIQAALRHKLEAAESVSPDAFTRQGPQAYRIIVSLKSPQAPAAQSTMNYRSAEGLAQIRTQVQALQETVLNAHTQGSLQVLHRYQSLSGFSAEADPKAIRDLAQIGEVEFVEEMPVMYKMDAESHAVTNTTAVHMVGYTGKGMTIAVIDDGIDTAHAVFGGSQAWPNAKILGGYDFADNDDDPRVDCFEQSHGTAVAGVMAGNGDGVSGTAPDASLVFLKVQHAMDCGQRGFRGDIAAGIDWAVTHRATYNIQIISMSLGGGAFSSVLECDNANIALRNAVNAAYAAGMIVFAAAGNEAQVGFLSAPACLSNVISVGATFDANVGPVGFSNCTHDFTDVDMVTCYSNSATFLNLLAPADCAQTARAGGGINHCFNGTSSATPFTAGVAATLLEAAGGQLNTDQLRQFLTSTGVELLDAKSNLLTPRIDAHAALQAVLGGGTDGPCTACDHFTGTLTAPGMQESQPDGTYYFSNAGTQEGWLEGPAGADFDLYLYQWTTEGWTLVAQSTSSTSSEAISYVGPSGYYTWNIVSYSGSGGYDFWLQHP